MYIGYFQNFNGSDSVLLDCTTGEIENISNQLENSSMVSEYELAIHSLAEVSEHNPVQLFAIFSKVQSKHTKNGAFYWLCAGEELTIIKDKLRSLSSAGVGHQYFSLAGSAVQLIVSVGEYGDLWWARNG